MDGFVGKGSSDLRGNILYGDAASGSDIISRCLWEIHANPSKAELHRIWHRNCINKGGRGSDR
jgi:hypothetical protein